MVRIYNVHLGAIAFVRRTLGCDYQTALRIAHLYGFLEHLASRGGAAALNQAGYAQTTGCHRNVIRKDLRTMESHGWIRTHTSSRGTAVELLGLPFENVSQLEVDTRCPAGWVESADQVDTPCPSGWTHGDQLLDTPCPPTGHTVSTYKKNKNNKKQDKNDAQPAAAQGEVVEEGLEEEKPIEPWREKPRAWTKAQRSQVVEIWNEHRPAGLMPLADDGLDANRAEVAARLMVGRGGFKKFVEYLPQVLEHLKTNNFWGDPSKSLSWDSFFGTRRSQKPHWAQSIDRIKSSCQASKPDKGPLAWDEANGWSQLDQSLTQAEVIDAAVAMVKRGEVPAMALKEIQGYRPQPTDD